MIAEELRRLRQLSYSELTGMVGKPHTRQVVSNGKHYQLDIEAVWDNVAADHVKIKVAADDGQWMILKPPADCFIMRPDGSIVPGAV